MHFVIGTEAFAHPITYSSQLLLEHPTTLHALRPASLFFQTSDSLGQFGVPIRNLVAIGLRGFRSCALTWLVGMKQIQIV